MTLTTPGVAVRVTVRVVGHRSRSAKNLSDVVTYERSLRRNDFKKEPTFLCNKGPIGKRETDNEDTE